MSVPETPTPLPVERGRTYWLWGASLLLFLPATLPYWCHFLLPPRPEDVPTGFLIYDMVYYLANAHKHFDDGTFHLTYGLPFSPDPDTPRIYFQPHTLLLAAVWRLTGWDPGTIFMGFGFVAGWICVHLALVVYKRLFGLQTLAQWLGAVAWLWGGGVLVLVGSIRFCCTGVREDLFHYDPFGGFWFLNLGRNFFFPTEAYYHALFLGSVLCILDGHLRTSAVLLLVLSLSHPFTGVEALLIVLAWAVLERFWIGNRQIPGTWIAFVTGILVLHLSYYLGLLNFLSSEHRTLQAQWTLEWTYEAQHFIPAYLLVGLFTFWSLRRPDLALTFFADWRNRFFLTWFLVAFALANHEFAIKPAIQPLHFTRGYVWMPLFLMGAPALLAALDRVLASRRGTPVALGLILVFLVDNAAFFGTFHRHSTGNPIEVYVDGAELQLAAFLDRPENHEALFLSPSANLNYHLVMYTPVRTWFSHESNTPHFEKRKKQVIDLYLKGTFQPEWEGRMLFVLYESALRLPPWMQERGGKLVYADEVYLLYRLAPRGVRSPGP